jgi:hypothetical protein
VRTCAATMLLWLTSPSQFQFTGYSLIDLGLTCNCYGPADMSSGSLRLSAAKRFVKEMFPQKSSFLFSSGHARSKCRSYSWRIANIYSWY